MWICFLGLLALEFSTAKTDYLAKIGLGLMALLGLFLLSKNPKNEALSTIRKLHHVFNKTLVFIVISAFFISTIGYYYLDYMSLNGTLWDLTMYIQQTYSLANFNQPIATFPGEIVNHFQTHRSLSLWILGFLYRIFLSNSLANSLAPYLVLTWQGFFLLAPGLVSMAWYLAVLKKNKLPPSPLGALLCFLVWAFMPAVLRMQAWPYTFYMMGFTILSLAYLFYYLENTFLAFICLALLPFEKEDFGIISFSFGCLIITENLVSLLKQKNISSNALKRNLIQISTGAAVIAIGIYSFWAFHKTNAKVVSFESRFGNFGKTPTEAVLQALSNPRLVFNALVRPDVLKYIWFFAFCSLLWMKSFLKWRNIKYFIPVLPVLIANSLASYEAMHQLKDPYALPITVGLAAVLILGIFESLLQKKGELLAHLALMVIAVIPLFWGHQSSFRTLKEKAALAFERKSSREILDPIRQDVSVGVCCEERLCSYLAARPFLLEARFCSDPIKGPLLLEQWKAKGVNKIYFIQYSNDSHFMKVSLR